MITSLLFLLSFLPDMSTSFADVYIEPSFLQTCMPVSNSEHVLSVFMHFIEYADFRWNTTSLNLLVVVFCAKFNVVYDSVVKWSNSCADCKV